MLNFLHSLITIMDPSDFVNTMDTRLAVSRIINWTMEPRNVDVRKVGRINIIMVQDIYQAPTLWLRALNNSNRLSTTYMYSKMKTVINLTQYLMV